MRVTRYTDYAFRALIYLGLLGPDELVTIGDIAADYGISRNHLMKVVQKLVQQGYLHSVRGKFGGVRLALPPEAVRLGDVARVTETRERLLDCQHDDCEPVCLLEPDCPVAGIMDEAVEAFFQVLDRYSLADVLARPERLGALVDGDHFRPRSMTSGGCSGTD